MSKEELMLLVLQHFQEEGLVETAKTFGRETGLYFDCKYFEDMVLDGKWDEVEKYLSGFMKIEDSNHSLKIYFELRKQKYLEALDSNDRGRALDILMKDLKVFSSKNEELFKELTQLLTVNNIREHDALSTYQDAISGRKRVMNDIKEIIENHPMLDGKLKIPANQSQSLKHLLIERLNCPAAPKEGIFINHVHVHSRPSTTASINQGTGLNNVGVPNEIARLAYTFAGNGIIALTSNGVHPLWVWPHAAKNLDCKETTQVCPILWHPKSDLEFMRNDLKHANGEDLVSCFAISTRDRFLISTSGGMTTLFDMVTFKDKLTILQPPPMVTCLAFYPEDNNTIVVGYDDSSIIIINVRDNNQNQIKLEGHSKRVTSFAFSNTLNVLVSADASAQIIVWNSRSWEKLRDRNLQINVPNVTQILSETQVHFHPDEKKFLVAHNIHLGIYEATELKCVSQWDPNFTTVINQATFSSNGQMVYASFGDGVLAIFDASNFQMHYMIHPSLYLSSISSLKIYPTAIAAHPHKPNQFAAGFTDGNVCVFEPKEPSVGSVVVDAEFDRDDYGSIPRNCDQNGAGTT
ncbi:topless-related protein [Trifolium repens]|nr:topless-related protein [Trifolium repens]